MLMHSPEQEGDTTGGNGCLQWDLLPALANASTFLAYLSAVPHLVARTNSSVNMASLAGSECPAVLRSQLYLAHVASSRESWRAQTLAVPDGAHPLRCPGNPCAHVEPVLWECLPLALHRG